MLDRGEILDSNEPIPISTLYGASLFFVLTTVTTVGYGDITPCNQLERNFTYCIMSIGVVAFSFASGSLSSIMSNYDSSEAKLNEKLILINKIRRQY